MFAMMAFQHRDLQVLNDSPACLQFTSIMAVSYKTIGISTSTVLASPVNFSSLTVCLPWLAFLSPQFGCHFRFHYLRDHFSNCLLGHLLHVALDLLQDRFSF